MEYTFCLLMITFLFVLNLFTYSEALYCFNCLSVKHPRFCEHVQECTADQICAVKRYIQQTTDEVLYSSGCMAPGTCMTNTIKLNGTQPCFKCCHSDLCNTIGCEEQAISQNPGNICFNCDGTLTPEECRTVMFCDRHELCYMEERSHFGELYYSSGCKDKHVCESNYIAAPIIGRREIRNKRSTSHLICCNDSLCNNNGHLISQVYPTSSTAALSTKGPFGKDFDIFFPKVDVNGYAIPYMLLVSLEIPYQLSITYNFENNNKLESVTRTSIITTQYSTFNLSSSVIVTTDGISTQGVTVHSNESIGIFCILRNSQYNEGYLALPAKYASTEYIIPSFNVSSVQPSSEYAKSIITVNPYYPDTTIHILVKTQQGPVTINSKPYENNSSAVLVLNDYDTLQISHANDLTGTLITSTKPVFVVSGNKCNYIESRSNCNPFMEMVLPVNQLDREYIIPVIYSRPKSTVRMLAATVATVTFTVNDIDTTKNLHPREYFDFTHEKISLVKSTGDIMVMLYPHEITSPLASDAYMMTIPGINQYLSEYIFAVPADFTSYVSVTVTKDHIDHFFLDGNPITTVDITNISHGTDNFSTFSFAVSPGMHRLKHVGGTAFGLWVYGDASNDGYGYPGGMAFRNN